jgi:hypothetical protein
MDNGSDNVLASLAKYQKIVSASYLAGLRATAPELYPIQGFESPRLQIPPVCRRGNTFLTYKYQVANVSTEPSLTRTHTHTRPNVLTS